MAIEIPSFEEFVEIVRAELRRNKPTIDPTVFGSWSRGFTDGIAAAASALGLAIGDLQKQLFPQTAEGEFLNLWGDYEGLERNAATPAVGPVLFTGTPGATIGAGAQVRSSSGLVYDTDASTSITTVVQGIDQITRVGGLAVAQINAGHQLASGITVTISGANEAEYNGAKTITVISETQFSFTVSGTPATPATGAISYSADVGIAQVTGLSAGELSNVEGNAPLTLINSIAGVDPTAYTLIDGLQGGADTETDDQYRGRILLSRSTIDGVFTEDQIIGAALSVTGNTRAFVKRPTVGGAGGALDPFPGQVAVYILRDNDANPIPPAAILTQTKSVIVANGALPAHMAEADLFVVAPTPVPVDFTFSALSPDTETMRQAIEDQLAAFFEDSVQFEQTVTKNAYISAIQTTQDPETGDFIESFTLSAPVGDVTVNNGEIATLGTVTFP